ncbi:unnamed protein product [Mytilus coruscus]|uniref:Uncharacterized protein n=1 Tax=Mytilus coruscus TaxID=42192 RepID=A0A6J8BVN8_MYTCO|nr:unnamed protein product [Mytilus coruscus]
MVITVTVFFGRIQEILEFYKLPEIDTLLLEQPSKLAFKYQCKCAIQKTWTNLLKSEIDNKSTLKYINAKALAIECPALFSVRQLYYSHLKVEVIHLVGERKWLQLFGNQESILLLIVDCSNFSENFSTEQITVITKISTELCHQLEIKRLKLLEGLRIASTATQGTTVSNL